MTSDLRPDLGLARGDWWATPRIRLVLRFAMLVGIALGIETVVLHLMTDPLADVHAYYDAAARLNAGQPLYVQPAGIDDAAFYRYPPLLAILFRPLALLPFGLAAAIWMTLIALMFVATLVRLDLRRPLTLFVVCALALPIGWSIVIGQAQVAVTLLLALGNPWAVALAANLKVFPILVAIWWLGRRDWRPLGWLAVWVAALIGVQLVLAPSDTLAYLSFLRLDQVGSVISLSPYSISPLLWAAMVVGLVVLAIWAAPRRYGWAVAVTLSVLASPRLLLYQLSSLVAGVRDPDDR
ncbi:MAG TPA: glycosyltransferase 87 family protein [Candidatus Limnocylindrales bacterium]